jgi:hypothetical protein
MKPIEVRPLTTEELTQLDELYRRTKIVRVRTRAQMILLGAEEKMTAPQIARIVRQDEQTVRRWIKRFNIEMLWRHFRREVTHCELFETVKLLLQASIDFFDRFNHTPEQVLSIIGVNPA